MRARMARAHRVRRRAAGFHDLVEPRIRAPDALRFPCVSLAREAIRQGGTAPAALNAANEIAVEAFLAARLPFTGIAEVIEQVLSETNVEPLESLEQVYAADVEARALAARFISRSAVPVAS